jgi:queuine tRNA-ribosyltransferase
MQAKLRTDLIVVLDDFTPHGASVKVARDTVERTIRWASRSKKEFDKIFNENQIEPGKRPYLVGVIQGDNKKMRKICAEELTKIEFDGLGFIFARNNTKRVIFVWIGGRET